MNFNEKLLSLRKNAGMSQDALAEKLGVTRQAVSKWEQGPAMPETKSIVQIAQVFGVTVDELVEYTPQENKNDLKSIFRRYSATFYFVLYEIFTVIYMFALAHISIVVYSIIRHTLELKPYIGISWNIRYFRFVLSVNIDNFLVAAIAGSVAFMITRYIRKIDNGV